ncbi:hypothetical protein V8043_004313, partial [Vibrio vulnificus]
LMNALIEGIRILLIKLVKKFFAAFEEELNASDYLDSELCSFPSGSCEITSQMLALYLKSSGVNNVVYTRNKTNQLEIGNIHYWVVVDDRIIIDLTAHQFKEFEGSAICDVDSDFHRLFDQLRVSSPDLQSLDRPSSSANVQFFERLMSRLERA